LPVELYNGRPIYYGLGNLCFKQGHGGRTHANWLGMVAELTYDSGKCSDHNFRFVRHNDAYETVFRSPTEEVEALTDLAQRSKQCGATLTADRVRVHVA
jgi:poly-gamma-glutamate capsule biosynthesis protein CapA/YwtB (metallophosphatase superfamily)